MSFADLQAANWQAILSGPGAEPLGVLYTHVPASGPPVPAVAIAASVCELNRHQDGGGGGTILNPIPGARLGELLPIYVTVLKSAVPLLRLRADKITWQGNDYVVRDVVVDDGVSVELYCVR